MPTIRAPRALPSLPSLLLGAAALLTLPACGDDAPPTAGACEAGLLPGDLVITEIMADPPGADAGREWFEIYNASPTELDLRGVLLVHSREDGTDAKLHLVPRSFVIPPDDYGVAGALLDEDDVLAVVPYVDYGYGDGLGNMRNTAGRLAVACDDTIIDEALYAEPTQGASRGFTGDRLPDASGNDDPSLWCDASSELDAESLGTPGASNDICIGTGGPLSCIEGGMLREARAPAPGDVVIAEVMANPEASEENDGEWVELYVGADIDLNGLALGTDPTGVEADAVAGNDCLPVAAGTRLVFAREPDPMINGGLPVVDQPLSFSLRNSDGQLVVSYAGQVLDVLAWASAPAGATLNLDPDFHTPEDNDDPRYLCAATTPYGAGDLGSPGAPNEDCAIPPPDGQCIEDDGSFRDIVPPRPGELVITEVMANPAAVDDTQGEWIELQALAELDLNGLWLGKEEGIELDSIDASSCLRLRPGEHALLARQSDPGVNGGLDPVDATFGFSLNNSSSAVWVGTDELTLDLVTWASTPSGASRSLDPAAIDPEANDDLEVWCAGVLPYGDGDLGTPGADNPSCGIVSTGTCTEGGVERELVPPQPGDLVITELMPDPSAVADGAGEWIEVLVTADVDLNGLELGDDPSSPDATLPIGGDCLAASAGDRVVLAKNADETLNGGLPPVLATFGFNLTNGGGTLFVGMGGEAFDTVTWTGSTPGAAWTVDPAAEDPIANDDPGSWCVATDPYGAGDRGTPGAQGPACGGGMGGDGMCLDGGVPRAIVSPVAGDLVITEWMANPDVVTDANGEWFEIYVGADVDLNGLQLSRATDVAGPFMLGTTLSSPDCLAVPAGTYVVLARNLDPLVNGGLPVADFAFSFGLNNGNAGLAVGIDDVHLDEVTWATSSAGTATQLDPAAQTPAGNDDAGNLCPATTPYGPGDNDGSPGAVNPSC